VERIASEVVSRDLESIAIMFLETVKPLSYIGSQLSMVFVGPFLSVFGNVGIDYIKFFEKKENVERLLKRIEEESALKDEENKTAKEHTKLISHRYGFEIELLPGYSLQENYVYEKNPGAIGVVGNEKIGCGRLMISFDLSTTDLQNEMAELLNREDVRCKLKISSAMTISKLGVKLNSRKIRGHN